MVKQRETFLTRRVLLSLCTAGMLALSMPQVVSADNASHTGETITEQVFNDTPGEAAKITVDNCTLNQQAGANEILNSDGGIIDVTNSAINGQIWSGKGGAVNVSGGTINFDLSNPKPMVRANAATVLLSGVESTVGNGTDGDHILAENGGKIVIENSKFEADISSTGNGSVISVKDSTVDDAYAYGGGSITAENSSFDALIAGQHIVNGNSSQVVGSGSIKLAGGTVNDYIFVTDGGKVETSGSTVTISNAVAFNGGSISIAGTAENEKASVTVNGDERYSDDIQPSTLYAYNKGQIALKNVDLTMTDISATPSAEMDKTFIHAEGAGSKITLENVKASIHKNNPNSNSDDPEIFAEKGGNIELVNADFSSGSGDVAAKGSGSIVTITDSSVADLEAYEGGAITVKNSTVEAVHAKDEASKIDITGGNVNDYIFVTNGGKVETAGSKVDISNAVAFDGGSISIAGTAENTKASVTVNGDERYSDDIQPSTLYAYNKGQIALKNVELNMTGISAAAPADMDKTFIHAEGAGSNIVLDGVHAVFHHKTDSDKAEIIAERGATIEIKDSDLDGDRGVDVAAKGSGSTLVLKGKTTMALEGSGFTAIDGGNVRIEGGMYGKDSSDGTSAADMQLITRTGGKIYLQGGKLYAHNFTQLQDKSFVLTGDGNLYTTSGMIFENGIDGANVANQDEAKKWAANVVDAGGVYNKKIDFQGGALYLDDAFYTQEYVDSALQSLHAVGSDQTKLDMLGDMIQAGSGEIIKEIPVDQVPDGAQLHNVAGITNDKVLAIGTSTGPNTMVVNKSIGLKNIDLGTAQSVTINNGKGLTLYTGNDKGELIASSKDITVTVDNGGTLTLGGAGNTAANQGAISGTVKVTGGKLAVVNGDYKIGKLEGGSGTTISVGDNQYRGSLVVEKANLDGATLFLDPAWGSNLISDASEAAFYFDGGVADQIDGRLVVGQNSVLSVGTTDLALAKEAFTRTGLQWGEDGVTAALYVDAPQTMDTNGKVFVDGTLNHDNFEESSLTDPTENFAANSLLIVNGASLAGDKAAFTGTAGASAQFKISPDAKIYIANTKSADVGETTYTIFGDQTTVSSSDSNGKIWGDAAERNKNENKNIIANALTRGWSSDNKTVTLERMHASEVYSGITLANTLDAITIDTASKNVGEAYLSNLLEGKAYGDASVARTVNATAQLAQSVGVAKTSIDAAQATADNAVERLLLTSSLPLEGEGDFWFQYIHNKTDVDGLSLAGGMEADYDASYNGFTIGRDFAHDDNRTFGVAFSYGDGDASSAYARDDFDFWGLTFYNGVRKDDKNFVWDIGYTSANHDVDGMGIAASPDTDVWTVGMRGERLVQQGNTKIVPYVGLRYMSVDTGSYSGSIGGKTAFEYDAGKQNIWLLPVGVNFSHEKKSESGWTYRPSLDLSYIFNFGDHDDDMTVRVPGVKASDEFSYDVTDEGSFVGKLGFEAERDAWKIGIGYARQQSADSHSDRFFANVSYRF